MQCVARRTLGGNGARLVECCVRLFLRFLRICTLRRGGTQHGRQAAALRSSGIAPAHQDVACSVRRPTRPAPLSSHVEPLCMAAPPSPPSHAGAAVAGPDHGLRHSHPQRHHLLPAGHCEPPTGRDQHAGCRASGPGPSTVRDRCWPARCTPPLVRRAARLGPAESGIPPTTRRAVAVAAVGAQMTHACWPCPAGPQVFCTICPIIAPVAVVYFAHNYIVW